MSDDYLKSEEFKQPPIKPKAIEKRKDDEAIHQGLRAANLKIDALSKAITNSIGQLKQTLTKDVQKVIVTNQPAPAVTQKVEIVNPPKQPAIQKVEVTNPPVIPTPPTEVKVLNLPVGEGDIPKRANPDFYVNVRLTDGKRFYKALESMMAGAGGGGDKISPATIGDLLNIQTTVSGWTQIVFGGEVIAFDVQCREARDLYITNTEDGARYWTIKAGMTKNFTFRMTRGWWLKAASGSPIAEVVGIR